MGLIYHYKLLPGKKGSQIKTPSIPVFFKGNSSLKMNTIALVDSGADCSVIPKGLAEILNLDMTGPKQDSYGFGGKIECIESNVNITLKQNHEKYEFKIPVLISSNDSCPIILGRNKFFDKFKITFDSKHQKLILKTYSA
ncbi:MAG: retroviral-like aspartic protease [Phycisphaerae bacterium]|nr:retroviral-like aspartic protease [Phycisphaerae bacterium]